jgi:hypothetical protein
LPAGSVLAVADQRFQVVYSHSQGDRPAGRGPAFAQSLLEAAGLARWRPRRDAAPGGGIGGVHRPGNRPDEPK